MADGIGLTNSTTSLPKATLVPLMPESVVDRAGGAARKASYVRGLALQPGEVLSARAFLAAGASPAAAETAVPDTVLSLLTRFEGSPPLSQLPSPAEFVNVTDSALYAFGNALTAVRQQAVNNMSAPSGAVDAAVAAGEDNTAASAANLGALVSALNAATVGTAAFWNSINASIAPVGMLNLESLQMTPAGLERGALLATVPLAPGERTEVVQKEWSNITDDYQSVVTDSLVDYSETGVTDNTQLTQSTTSQLAHSDQFNISASVSGGIPLVTNAQVQSGFSSQDQNSSSASASATHAQQTTRKASSRSTQSHKVTISTVSTSGTSEGTTRMLVNPSTTDPMRIDYFSIMRKWVVGLYRYGLRLTYDVTVPEPGAAMREAYRTLAELQAQESEVFVFSLPYGKITPATYKQLAAKYGATVPEPPTRTCC